MGLFTAQIMAGAPQGGAELFFERLCTALQRAGDPVLAVIRRDPARAERLRAAAIRMEPLPFRGLLDRRTIPALARLLREVAPPVVMAWMGRAAACTPPGPWTLVGRLGGYYDLRRFRRCDHLVGNTADIADWIRKQGVAADRVHHLPNFVPDLRGAAPTPRATLGVPPGAPLLLALGRLHPNKGFDLLIRALASLPDAHAVIAGEGAERNRLASLARDLGLATRVHLPGWIADAAPLLAAADIVVCPSRHEPLGNVVLEAWSAGRPVIAAAAQGPRALITPCQPTGQTGLLVPIDDAGALADAIAGLLAAPPAARALADAGRARFETTFAEAPVLAQWRDFFARVAR